MGITIDVNHRYFLFDDEKMNQRLDTLEKAIMQLEAIALGNTQRLEGLQEALRNLESRFDQQIANAAELAELKSQIASLSRNLSDSTDALNLAISDQSTATTSNPST